MVLELPSISDIADIIIFLIPGFVTFVIARKIGIIDHKFSDLETVVLIIVLSLFNYIPFGYITGIENLNEIGNKIFNPPFTLVLIIITIVMGLIIGALFKIIFKRSSVAGSSWDQLFENIPKGAWVYVFTDKREYQGILINRSEGDIREAILKNPKQVIRDHNYRITHVIELGKSIIFTDGEIKSLVIR